MYVPLDFENGLTIDALVDSGAYVSAIAQKELDRIQQQAPFNILKIDDPPNFQIQVANGQLEKPTATATLKFDIGDHTFADHFVVMKNLTGPIIGLHFMKHNSVVIDTTHGLIHFPHLTMQVKSALSQASGKPQPVLIYDSKTIQQMTTKTITAYVDHSSEWNTTGTVKVHRSREPNHIPFNVNNNRQENSSQSNLHNGITLYDQQKHTNCRILRSHSGAIQDY